MTLFHFFTSDFPFPKFNKKLLKNLIINFLSIARFFTFQDIFFSKNNLKKQKISRADKIIIT